MAQGPGRMPPSAQAVTENYLRRLVEQLREREGELAAELLRTQLQDLPGLFAFLEAGELDPEARRSLARLLPATVRALRAGQPLLDEAHPYPRFLARLADFAGRPPARGPELAAWRRRIGELVEQARAPGDLGPPRVRELLGRLERLERREAQRREGARRRAAQAARAQERLEQSREAAARVVAHLLEQLPAAPAAAELLSGPWENVVVILCLRHGRDGLETVAAVKTAQQLLRWSTGGRPLPERLAGRLADGLGLVGFSPEEAHRHVAAVAAAVADWRQGDAAVPPQDGPRAPPVEAARTPAAGAAEAPEAALQAAVDVPPPPPAPRERDRSFTVGGTTMTVGDWVELRRRDGSSVAAKLSWVSPITGNLLFVDDRGMRVADLSLEDFRAGVAAREARLLGARP